MPEGETLPKILLHCDQIAFVGVFKEYFESVVLKHSALNGVWFPHHQGLPRPRQHGGWHHNTNKQPRWAPVPGPRLVNSERFPGVVEGLTLDSSRDVRIIVATFFLVKMKARNSEKLLAKLSIHDITI